ncbi:PREDICTED: N-alpha-acetyltransferase 50 [Nipponia nippon]|uniref:N-alpha-acetyltransferase 50 n=1 Tax=Nipponia nippon TaxID=128390 RepID=UPI000510A7F2|nr:PREDICTED: N-alpha-acetyltransferase 50 [Nipponia nippon]
MVGRSATETQPPSPRGILLGPWDPSSGLSESAQQVSYGGNPTQRAAPEKRDRGEHGRPQRALPPGKDPFCDLLRKNPSDEMLHKSVSDVKHILICSSSRIELGDVTPHNIKQLKRLNQVIFPVSYNDKFYKDVLEVGELAKLAYFNDIAVGAVCCRVDHSQNQKRLYIMTLGCLAPYRRLGIGTKMLNHVLNICEKDGTFDNIYLHVQISNESAIDFYRKFGFEIIETKKNYYKRIEPADAHVLQKNLKAPCLGQNADVQKTDN